MHSGVRIPYGSPRALSSAGRAPALQAGGRRFDPVSAHHSYKNIAGWSSTVARRAHNPKVAGSNPVPATKTWSCGEVGVHAGLSHRRSRVRVPSAPPCFEPLAQLVEHLTFNQGVTGSSPVWLTILCRSGGIGRRARLKIVFRKECRFDPDLRYHYYYPNWC
jgi:hypothetical protein